MNEYSICDDESLEALTDLLAVEKPIKVEGNKLVFVNYVFQLSPDYIQSAYKLALKSLLDVPQKTYVIIKNFLELDYWLKEIDKADVVSYDTETTGLNVRKDKVIGFSVCIAPGKSFYLPLQAWNKETGVLDNLGNDRWVNPILKRLKHKKVIMHNGSYDVRITKSNFGIDLTDCLHADTVLMLHTLNEEDDFALKEAVINRAANLYLDGQDAANQEQLALKESVLANGGKWTKNDKEIYKGDMPIVGVYCCADTDMTIRLWIHAEHYLHLEGLANFFYNLEVMDHYRVVTMVMEDRGVHIDLPKLAIYQNEIKIRLEEIKTEVLGELYKLPETEQYINKFLEEEYPITRSGNFAQAVVKYYNINLPSSPNGKYSITKKGLTNIADQENVGIQFLTGAYNLPDEVVLEVRKIMHGSSDFININSKPQLGAIVFDYMKLEPLGKTPGGSPQFDEDFVDHIADKYKFDWAKKLKTYNKLNKIEGTYYRRLEEGCENGVFYPSFKQHATTSGRLSSDFQQLPKPIEEEDDTVDDDTRYFTDVIRELVIPAPGYVFIDDDYESLEPRVFADDAADQALIDIFTNGFDFYSTVAIGAQNLTGVSANKKDENFLKKVNPKLRQDAKEYALGIRYGMQAYKLHKILDIPIEEAERIVNNYFKAFPKLKKKMDGYTLSAKKTGKVISKFGRIRHLPRVKEIYEKFGDDITDFRKMKGLANKHGVSFNEVKQIRKEYTGLLNNALNFPIQSAASSIVARAAVAIMKRFKAENLDAWISLSVHDQLVITSNKNCVDKAKVIVQDCMENTNKLLMPLIAKPEVAMNLSEGH